MSYNFYEILKKALNEPIVDVLILNNATINTSGSSAYIGIKGAKHIDLLIDLETITGTPNITFHIKVIERSSGGSATPPKVIRTYDGNSLGAAGTDYITIDGLTLGDTIQVTWDGTLDSSNYFSNVYVRLIAKR